MRQIYKRAVEHFPKEADFDYIVGRFFAALGKAGKASSYLEAALKKLDDFGSKSDRKTSLDSVE